MLRMLISKASKERVLVQAVEILERGGIVAYPTETFYGLGVKFDMEDSLKKLYDIKQRPKDKATPLIIGNKGLLPLVTKAADRKATLLMDRFWPGPLTLILPAKENISRYITTGAGRVAIRIPGESFALYLAKTANFPITATSANLSGMPPAKDAETVIGYFGDKIDLVIDGGPTPGGLPSTIVDVTGKEIKILREGAISRGSLEKFLEKNS
ncbi:MAG: L-threonylcarbamoyladenylate synthase [Nitrospirota bacterium]